MQQGGAARRGARRSRTCRTSRTVVPVFDVESIERTRGGHGRPASPAAGSSSRASTSTSGSSPPFRRTTTRSRCASSSAPAFIDWITRIPAEVDFGITDQQLFFHWRLRERTKEELKEALQLGGRHLRPAPSRDGGEQPRHLQARAPGTRASSRSRREAEPRPARSEALAVGPVEARALLDEVAEAADRPRGARIHRRSCAAPAPGRSAERTRSPRTCMLRCQVKSGAWGWTVRQARPSISGSPAGVGLDPDLAARRIGREGHADGDREAVGPDPAEHAGLVLAEELHPLVPGRRSPPAAPPCSSAGSSMWPERTSSRWASWISGSSARSPSGQTKTRSGRTLM